MFNIRVASVLMCVSVLALGAAKAHDFRPNAKAPPDADNLVDESAFDQTVRTAPDDGTRWLLSRALLWKPGSTLSACFLDGSQNSRAAVINDAQYLVATPAHPVNLKISFANGSATDCNKVGGTFKEDIRVTFNNGCCSAYVGRVSHNTAVAAGANVFLQEGLDDATIKHELMHALGFQHEHQKPNSPCDFNYPVIENAYGWTLTEVQNNFNKLNNSSHALAGSLGFDGASIMKYYFDPSFLKSGTSSPCYTPQATDLSPTDWDGLKTAYPPGFDAAKFKAAATTAMSTRDVTAGMPAALKDAIKSSVSDY
jgi:Astacin (Peptidase family M12A)